MKNIFKYTYLALVGMVAMVAASCSDDYKYDGRGEWDAADGYANIYFAITDSTLELDPADPTIVTVAVSRRNTQGALTIPFEIHQNTDDVFTVSDAVFADGEAEAEITLSFPNAEIGKPYTLEITTSDPEVVSQYSAGAIYTIEVTRVKWNDVGFYYKENADGEKEKVDSVMYTDVFIGRVFSTGYLTYPVKLQERDDQKGIFRIINAYGAAYPYNDPGDWDDSKDYYIIINATDPEKVYISPSDINMGVDWGYGYFHALNYAGYYVEIAKEYADAGDSENEKKYLDAAESVYGKYENGKITFPAEAFFVAMEDYGYPDKGWNSNEAFVLVINPDLNPHNADMSSDEDFEWEEVYAGLFESAQLDTQKEGVKLYKGTCINTTDSCDVRFAKEYGTAYKIESPYAEGYHLYFAVDSTGAVTLPEDLKYQNTGMKAVGADVYAVISPAASTFTELVITLKIAFQTQADKDGNYTEYGSAEEVLSNITWTSLGTGLFVDDFVLPLFSYDPEPYEVEIEECDQFPGQYRLVDMYATLVSEFDEDGGNENIVIHAEDPEGVYILEQPIGANFGYGEMSIVTEGGDYVAYYGYDVTKQNYPEVLGTLKDGVITFPVFHDDNNDIDYQGYLVMGSSAYYAGKNGAIEIYLPEALEDASLRAKAQSRAKAASFAKRLNASKKFAAKTKKAAKSHSFGKGTKANAKHKRVLNTPSNAPLFVK